MRSAADLAGRLFKQKPDFARFADVRGLLAGQTGPIVARDAPVVFNRESLERAIHALLVFVS